MAEVKRDIFDQEGKNIKSDKEEFNKTRVLSWE